MSVSKKQSVKSSGNEQIIQVLETVKSYYARERDSIHVSAYERAIYQIRKWPHQIKAGKEVAHLEGIGKGMVQKIDTILSTGTLPIIQEKGLAITSTRKTKKSSLPVGGEISKVLGFSAKTAAALEMKYGIRTIEELKAGTPELNLTKIQQMGLQYHADLKEKVPREEITQIGDKIATALEGFGIMVFLAGSYPSGLKKESKDIDILLVARDSRKLKSKSYLLGLVHKLQASIDIQLETITLGANKFLGIVKLANTGEGAGQGQRHWRHLDMRLVDMSAFPFAWLYYASGVVFNKLIREKLKKRKNKHGNRYKLNEWGLFQHGDKLVLEGEQPAKELEKEIQSKEDLLEYTEQIEKEIFKLANLEYKTIPERY